MNCVCDVGFIFAGVMLNFAPVPGMPWHMKVLGTVLALVYTARLAADWINNDSDP